VLKALYASKGKADIPAEARAKQKPFATSFLPWNPDYSIPLRL